MPNSDTSATIDWVESLTPNSWFWAKDIPGRPHVIQPVLSRLCSDHSLGLRRVARGLYWRGYPGGHDFFGVGPDYEISALIYAGAGAGLAGWNALNRLGWTLQCDPRSSVSVLDRRLQPISPTVQYFTSRNTRREHLSWAEVSILEALALIDYAEEPWNRCLDFLAEGRSASRFNWDFLVRPDLLLMAGETEDGNTADTLHLIGEICEVLTDGFDG